MMEKEENNIKKIWKLEVGILVLVLVFGGMRKDRRYGAS